jgi:hypothetical protein
MGDALISETFQDGHYVSQFRHKKSVLNDVRGLSGEDFEVLIGLAGAAFREMKNSVNALSYAEALEREVGKAVGIVQARAASAACTLEGDLRTEIRIKEAEYKRNLQGKVAEKEELSRQLEAARALSLTAEAGLQAARGQLGEADRLAWEKYEKILTKSEEKMKETIKERLDQNAAQHAKAYLELKEIYDKETAKLRKENDKSHVSSEKGKQGEREFEEICKDYIGWGPLENTSKEAHATDRRGTIKGCPTMFEIKKYKDNVPTKEVVKFQRDMKENGSSPFGVFVSLTSDICNKLDKYIHIEWTEEYQLLLYINHLYTHPIPETMEFIETCAGIAQSVYNSAKAKVESETSVALTSRIEQAKFLINKELTSVAEGIKAVELYKTNLVNTITNQHNDLKRIMTTSKQTLQAMIGILIGREAEAEEVQVEETQDNSSLETVPGPKEQKKRSKKIDVKSK